MRIDFKPFEAELCKRKFSEFVKRAWPQVDPAPLEWGWHMDAICDQLQAVYEGKITELVINIPPGMAKSLLCSVLFPAWVWTRDPSYSFLCSSYSFTLSTRDNDRCRTVITSEWYKELFPYVVIKPTQNEKKFFELIAMGAKRSIAEGTIATGLRGHMLIVDDPLNAHDRDSEAALWSHVDFFDNTLSSRSVTPNCFPKIVVQQRLHFADLAGRLIDRGWTALVLPMEYDPERKCRIEATGFEDPRTVPGETLMPSRYSDEAIASLKLALGDQWHGQYNQIPVSAEGGELKRHWIRYWYPKDGTVPNPVRLKVGTSYIEIPQVALDPDDLYQGQSWDPSVKETKNGSFCCGMVWGHKGPNDYLLGMFHKRCEFTAQVQAVRDLSAEWPLAWEKLIEDKANGPAIVSTLKSEMSGIQEYNGTKGGDKIARFKSVTPHFKSGNIYIPHPDVFPWVVTVLNEWTQFPKSPNDDIVDATSQWLDYRHRNGVARLERMMML